MIMVPEKSKLVPTEKRKRATCTSKQMLNLESIETSTSEAGISDGTGTLEHGNNIDYLYSSIILYGGGV